jgi:hypothetical protein
MSKREINHAQHNTSLNQATAEEMCTKKLRKMNGNLYQTVLVRNTLKYIQASKYVTHNIEPECVEYEPCEKKHCPGTSILEDVDINDIEDILSEMFLPHPIIPPDEEEFSYDCPVRGIMSRAYNTCDDSVLPDTEVLENDKDYIKHDTEYDYISELLSNRSSLTVTLFTKQLKPPSNEHSR